MQFKPPQLLSRWARVARSILIIALLFGSLLPRVAGVNVVAIAIALSIPVVLYEILRWLPRAHRVLFYVVPLFGLIASSALVIPPTSEYGQSKLLTFLTLTLLSAFAACLIRDQQSVITLAWTWTFTASGLGVLALLDYATGNRAGGFDTAPIGLARMFAAAGIIVLWMWWQKLGKPIPMLLLLVLLIGALFATGSRGPAIGLAIGVILLTLSSPKAKVGRVVSILLIGGGALVALQALPIFDGSRLTGSDPGAIASDQARALLWQASVPVIQAHPFGVGIGNWAAYAEVPTQFTYPHNIFLEVTVEMGVPIALFFLAMTALVFIRLMRVVRSRPAAALVLALLAAETFDVCVSGDLNGRTLFFLLTLGFLFSGKQGNEHAPNMDLIIRPGRRMVR